MINSSVNQVIYNGNGVAREFAYSFVIIDKSDLHLTLVDTDGTETAITTDYYVDANASKVYYPGYAPGAEPPEADQPPVLATGQKLIIYRDVPITQLSSLSDVWPFNVIEKMGDKGTIIDQQLKADVDRSVKTSRAASSSFDNTIPVPTDNNNHGIRITKDGLELVNDPSEVYGDTVAIKNQAEAAKLSAQNAASVAQAWAEENAGTSPSKISGAKSSKQWAGVAKDFAEKGTVIEVDEQGINHYSAKYWRDSIVNGVVPDHSIIISKLVNGTLGYVTPEMYGAVGDGVADDTAALQQAIDSEKLVLLPNVYRITSTINVPAKSFIMGANYSNDNNTKSTIIVDLTSDGIAILVQGKIVTLSSFKIIKKSDNTNTITAIQLARNVNYSTLEHICIMYCSVGIDIVYCWSMEFRHLHIYYADKCIVNNGLATSAISNSDFFDSEIAIECNATSVKIYRADFDNCHIGVKCTGACSVLLDDADMENYSSSDGGTAKSMLVTDGKTCAIINRPAFYTAGEDFQSFVTVTSGKRDYPIIINDYWASGWVRINVTVSDDSEYGCVQFKNCIVNSNINSGFFHKKCLYNGYYPTIKSGEHGMLHCEYIGTLQKRYYGYTDSNTIIFTGWHMGVVRLFNGNSSCEVLINTGGISATPTGFTYDLNDKGNYQITKSGYGYFYIDVFVSNGGVSPSDYSLY